MLDTKFFLVLIGSFWFLLVLSGSFLLFLVRFGSHRFLLVLTSNAATRVDKEGEC